MSIADEKNFYDVTPHRIQVTSKSASDDYGHQVEDPTTLRTYRCYVVEKARVSQNLQGTQVTFPVTAYVLATPVDNHGNPVGTQTRILDDDEVVFLTPLTINDRHLGSVESYYDADGSLNNMVLGFS